MRGLYFEEMEDGAQFSHPFTRTVTEMDNVLFTSLTMNPQPLHLDEEFARTTEFGQRIVNSLFTLGLPCEEAGTFLRERRRADDG